MLRTKTLIPHQAGLLVLAAMVAATLTLTACDSAGVDAPGHGVEQVVISPQSTAMGVGQQAEFSAFALTAEGDTVDTSDLEIQWDWWSSDPAVFTVDDAGNAVGVSPGEEYCIVEATILAGTSNFSGRDSAFVMVF
jgi:hypothetical protein